MEISGAGNVSPAQLTSTAETPNYDGGNSKPATETTEAKSSGSSHEPSLIPTAESNTGGQLNVSV